MMNYCCKTHKWVSAGQFRKRLLCLALSFIIYHSSFMIIPAQAQSVLAQGAWVKIGVTESGVYRLSQAQLIQLNPGFATADPKRLRLYGNGGAVLPQPNDIPRPD